MRKIFILFFLSLIFCGLKVFAVEMDDADLRGTCSNAGSSGRLFEFAGGDRVASVCCTGGALPTGTDDVRKPRCRMPGRNRGMCGDRNFPQVSYCMNETEPYQICCPRDTVATCDPNPNAQQCRANRFPIPEDFATRERSCGESI
jgi:hypothetical protein